MKKFFTLLLVVAMSVSVASCCNNSELEELKKEVASLKEQLQENNTTSTDTTSDAKADTKSDANTSKNTQSNAGDPIKVHTEKGDYSITVLNAHKANSVEDKGNHPIIVSLDIENISYVYDDDETYFMPWSPYKGYIKISDEEKYMLKYYDCSGPTELNNPKQIPVGFKETANFAFFPNTPNVMPKKITVQVFNGTEFVGSSDIDVTEN